MPRFTPYLAFRTFQRRSFCRIAGIRNCLLRQRGEVGLCLRPQCLVRRCRPAYLARLTARLRRLGVVCLPRFPMCTSDGAFLAQAKEIQVVVSADEPDARSSAVASPAEYACAAPTYARHQVLRAPFLLCALRAPPAQSKTRTAVRQGCRRRSSRPSWTFFMKRRTASRSSHSLRASACVPVPARGPLRLLTTRCIRPPAHARSNTPAAGQMRTICRCRSRASSRRACFLRV